MNNPNEKELVEQIKNRTLPLEIIGGGTRKLGLPLNLEHFGLSHFNSIKLYEPGALTLIAEAGCKLSDINMLLKENGQMLPFEPMDMTGLLKTDGHSTLGGVVATNASGPRRVKVGACRDYVLGLRFVDGEGNLLKTGGRVMKNVTGYDLVKLLCGSHGTLGIITEIAIKVLPAPAHSAVISIEGLSEKKGLSALRKSLASPYEVSGASHFVSQQSKNCFTKIRVEGTISSVKYRVSELSKLLSEFGNITVDTDPEKTQSDWGTIRDVGVFWNTIGDVWKISTKPTESLQLATKIRQNVSSLEVLYDWGGGLIWILVPEQTPVRKYLAKFHGFATLVRGNPDSFSNYPVFHPKSKSLENLTFQIRKQFDPRQIFNRGFAI